MEMPEMLQRIQQTESGLLLRQTPEYRRIYSCPGKNGAAKAARNPRLPTVCAAGCRGADILVHAHILERKNRTQRRKQYYMDDDVTLISMNRPRSYRRILLDST